MHSTTNNNYSAILISDLAKFTDFSRKIPAEKLYELLKDYFKMMHSIIRSRKGNFVKTLGDGLLCYFRSNSNTRKDRISALLNSVLASIDMKIVNSYLNSRKSNKEKDPKLPEINLRIAINSGIIRIGPLIGSKNDVIGSAVNLVSRVVDRVGRRGCKEYETEPIVATEMVEGFLKDHVTFCSSELRIDNIKGFGDLKLGLKEVINYKCSNVLFSECIKSKISHYEHEDHFTGRGVQSPIYGPFPKNINPNLNFYIEYPFNSQQYEKSEYVLLQLPLLATAKGRRGDSENWKNLYFVHDGNSFQTIIETSGLVFNEPKPFEYAPCIDLKRMEKNKSFSKGWISNGKLRIYLTLENDGSDDFYVQPLESARWRRVYLGIVYI